MENNEIVLKASSKTNVGKLAGAIVASYEKEPTSEILIRSVGAGAVNQATKATIIANRQLIKKGKLAYILPSFDSFEEGKTALVYSVKIRKV